ncbi:unnamed protein product [Ilex paraguariensis]|uniref:GATA-type domain-containing protein n=1 Tax=Ilex paraguariensis TaxID=185542 RepID=A0ABC8V2B3_9AQUA
MNTHTPDRVSSDGNQFKTCAECGTSKTPLWRGGPAGPKSLCNACGIKSRKKRRVILSVNKEDKKPKKTSSTNTQHQKQNQNHLSSGGGRGNKLGESVKRKLFSLGREVVLQRPRPKSRSTSTAMAKQRRKLGEEEQAAFLLMALSCGYVFAYF